MVDVVFVRPMIEDSSKRRASRPMLNSLAIHEQKAVLQSALRIISKIDITSKENKSDTAELNAKRIGGKAALLASLMGNQVQLKEAMAEWLTTTSGGSAGVDESTRRAAIAALTRDKGLWIYPNKVTVFYSNRIRAS